MEGEQPGDSREGVAPARLFYDSSPGISRYLSIVRDAFVALGVLRAGRGTDGGPGFDNTGRDGVELVEGSLERWVLPETLFLGYRPSVASTIRLFGRNEPDARSADTTSRSET